MKKDDENSNFDDNEKYHKINSLREMISTAEKTIQGAKAMLLQLEGKKKVGRKRKTDDETEGNVVEGTFDGQIMVGTDGKQYPVPANYASKSKLVEGDTLKLTITPDGFFIYKQIGPADRKHALGVVSQDEVGNYYVLADGNPYKVLLASVTYFKAEPGDEVAIIIPRQTESTWAAIENVIKKGRHDFIPAPDSKKKSTFFDELDSLKKDLQPEGEKNPPAESAPSQNPTGNSSVVDEWDTDIEAIKEEIRKSQNA
jgi:hypothetical protein